MTADTEITNQLSSYTFGWFISFYRKQVISFKIFLVKFHPLKNLVSPLYLGEIVAGQYCSGCTNSLGVAIVKDKDGEEVILSSLSDTHSVVFFDSKKNNAKLGCGEITNGLLVETS